jgi:hypothetical protein
MQRATIMAMSGGKILGMIQPCLKKTLYVDPIPKLVIPAKAGIHRINYLQVDSHGFRLKDCRNDGVYRLHLLIDIYALLY